MTVIVDEREIGEKKVYVGCAVGEQQDGLEALENAGFTPAGTKQYGLEFICRIDEEPTFAEQSCEQTPPVTAYWSYWHGKPGGRWEYSKYGARSSNTKAPVNTVEGWSFGDDEEPRIEPQQEEGYDAAFDQRSLPFETRTVGSPSKPSTATVTNDDVRPVTISGAAVEGADAGDFAIAVDGCGGRTLAPGESCEVSVSFDPTAAGLREALLALTLGNSQRLALALTGTGEAAKTPAPVGGGHEPAVTEDRGPTTGSQGVLGTETVSPLRVEAVRLDSAGVASGLVGVSWQLLQSGAAVRSWTIAAKPAGSRQGYVNRLSGAGNVTSAQLKLPAGVVYELQITFTDAFAATTTLPIGRVAVPYDDRSGMLHYSGRWRRVEQPGAWLDTITRGTSGGAVSLRLAAGRPVFELRASPHAAEVEVRAGSYHDRFAVEKGRAQALRTITAGARTPAGTVTLRVLRGTVDLDGVALED